MKPRIRASDCMGYISAILLYFPLMFDITQFAVSALIDEQHSQNSPEKRMKV